MSTIRRRLDALEARFGLDGRSGTALDRAVAAVMMGSASLADFELALGDDVELARCIVSLRASYFRAVRDLGWWQPWASLPIDLAADIAAITVDDEPDPDHVANLKAWSALNPASHPSRRTLSSPSASFVSGLWRDACISLVALGEPNGGPLREQIAAGRYDDARDRLEAAGLLDQVDAWPLKTCEPWKPLPDPIGNGQPLSRCEVIAVLREGGPRLFCAVQPDQDGHLSRSATTP